MQKFIFVVFLLFVTTILPAKAYTIRAERIYTVEALWLTENERAVIQIEKCDDSLCGYVYWIIDGGMEFDTKNPNPNNRNDPLCGLQILKDFERKAEDKWEDGTIYKADDGDTYNADIKLSSTKKLEVRGYIGLPVFGKTQTWTRVYKSEYEPCKPAS